MEELNVDVSDYRRQKYLKSRFQHGNPYFAGSQDVKKLMISQSKLSSTLTDWTSYSDVEGSLVSFDEIKAADSLKELLSNISLRRIFGYLLQAVYASDFQKLKVVFELIDGEWRKAAQDPKKYSAALQALR